LIRNRTDPESPNKESFVDYVTNILEQNGIIYVKIPTPNTQDNNILAGINVDKLQDINGGILLLVLNLDNFVKPEYLPWKEHGGHIEYTRFKVSVLEPIKDVRASVYNMVGINEENKPTNNQIFAMIGAGLLLTILIYLIPVRLFTFIVVVGLNTIPRYLRNRNEKKAQKLESERQQIKEELKKQDIYLKKDDRHNLANANKDEVDKELLEKAEKRAALKRQMKEQFAELDLRKKKK